MDADSFLAKAEESLASAEDDYVKGRYNSCARSIYYAAFQAAIAALLAEGIRPRGRWEHEFVHGQFAGMLVHRRKRYPSRYSGLLPVAFQVRTEADYTPASVGSRTVQRLLNQAKSLLTLVKGRSDGNS